MIRRATPDDARGIALLLAAVAEERRWIAMRPPVDVDALQARVRASLADETMVSFVADRDGSIVGDASLMRRGERTVLGMCLREEERGRRFGGMLLDAALAGAKACRFPVVTLDVYEHNAAARRLYRTRGFAVVGEADVDDRGGGVVFGVITMERRTPGVV